MLARVQSAVLTGVEATPVEVECCVDNGLPAFTIVGLPDTSVQEARERVRAAITHAGQPYPMQRITVNLAPSDVRKHGPGLDLAVALGLLVAQERIPQRGLDGRLVIGELGLSGTVRPVRGALASAEAARAAGLEEVVCPAANASEAALAGLPALPVSTLRDAIAVVNGTPWTAIREDAASLLERRPSSAEDLAQIRGQVRAKRALEIAAAGAHNLLLSGPPGAGKTLLARALPAILPRLGVDEALEVTRIHSAAGLMRPGDALVSSRPFRAPHHGVSAVGLIGGGSSLARPGEISLAHRGVLFLDEFPEFPRSCLEALRQPLEDGMVTVVRARHAVAYPARFMLVAAMNPCPCGHLGSAVPCRCPPRALEMYRQRLSGPLLDRIDLHVEVPRVEAGELLEQSRDEDSRAVRERVEAARTAASDRRDRTGALANAEIPPGELLAVCELDARATRVLAACADRHRLSARSIHRTLRVARTVADLEGSSRVGPEHVLEAVSYRVSDARRSAEDGQ